jgi:hypothetical protein
MSNQHTENHNEAFTFAGALRANHVYESIVNEHMKAFDNAAITPIPWKQYHRANVPHLGRRST